MNRFRAVRAVLVLPIAACLVGSAGSGVAEAADALAPLRVLVYDVQYSTTTTRREHTSGFTFTPIGATGSVAGAGLVDRRFTNDETGQLRVAIVAASRDGALAADVSFVGKNASQPTVRVAILADGRLSIDPKLTLAPAAIRILPFLARGLVAERNINPDSTWSVEAPPPATGTTTYRVLAVDGDRATIQLAATVTFKGAAAIAESVEGRTVYETTRLSPLSVDMRVTTRRDVSAEENEWTDGHIVARMVSDTFAPHG